LKRYGQHKSAPKVEKERLGNLRRYPRDRQAQIIGPLIVIPRIKQILTWVKKRANRLNPPKGWAQKGEFNWSKCAPECEIMPESLNYAQIYSQIALFNKKYTWKNL